MSTNPAELRQQKISSLESEYETLVEKVSLADISSAVGDLSTTVATLPNQVQEIRARGYAFRSYLENKAQVLGSQWNTIQRQVQSHIMSEANQLQQELNRLTPQWEMLHGNPQNEAVFNKVAPTLETALQSLDSKADGVISRIQGMYSQLETDANQMVSQISEINWVMDQKDEASFDFLAGETVFLAAKAEWTSGKDKPDGILFLTDQRLVFEQKETTGKTLGLFGGKKAHEKEWEVPLNQVEKVVPENKGFLGGKDMLNFTLGAGATYPTLTVEVKGGVDCKFWAKQIERMHSGDVKNERAIEPDPEVIEALKKAPTACHVCGGTLPMLVAGQNQITCPYCGAVIRI